MLYFISQGLGLGFTAGSIPGPMHTYMVNQTLLRGLGQSLVIMFTPLLSDGPLIILMVLILDQLPSAILTALRLLGGGFMLWLAWGAWQQANAQPLFQLGGESQPTHTVMLKALFINWFNPAPYIFWSTVNGPLLVEALDQSVGHGIAFLVAFYAPLCGMLGVVGLIFHFFRRLEEHYVRGVMRFSALVLCLFGLLFIYQGILG